MIEADKKFIFVWVPGTGGHEVHEAFAQAVHTQHGKDAQIIVVDYPASWDFDKSVPEGEKALKATLKQLSRERTLDQKVLVAGSSQGAWVISNVYTNTNYNDVFASSPLPPVVTKTVLFGHPGVADSYAPESGWDDSVWEINDAENDAVTFGWPGNERRLIRAAMDLKHGKVWKLPVLLWEGIKHPVKFMRIGYLVACYTGLVWWTDSPHEYARTMPLAVYWLTH